MAGHAEDQDDAGRRLLIDTHDRRVIDDVWALYGRAMSRAGAIPTLVEWDEHIPDWLVLLDEARRAEAILQDVSQAGTRAMHAPVMEHMG